MNHRERFRMLMRYKRAGRLPRTQPVRRERCTMLIKRSIQCAGIVLAMLSCWAAVVLGAEVLRIGPLQTRAQPDIEGFMWWLAPPEQRVNSYPVTTRRAAGHQSPTEPIVIRAARGEYEAAQVVLSPGRGVQLKQVQLRFTDLVNDQSNAVVGSGNFDWRMVQYVTISEQADSKFKEWWAGVRERTGLKEIPDVLRPVEQFDTSSTEHRNYPLWITLHVPYGTPAGLYRGQVTLHMNAAPAASRPIEVTVWDFDMPPDIHVRTGLFSLGTDFANYHFGFTHRSPAAFRLITDA